MMSSKSTPHPCAPGKPERCPVLPYCWCHRITELLILEETSGDHRVQPPAKAKSPKAGHTGTWPGGFLMSPEESP